MDAEKYRPQDRAYDPEPIADRTARSTLVIAVLLLVVCFAAGWLLLSGGSGDTSIGVGSIGADSSVDSSVGSINNDGGAGSGASVESGASPAMSGAVDMNPAQDLEQGPPLPGQTGEPQQRLRNAAGAGTSKGLRESIRTARSRS